MAGRPKKYDEEKALDKAIEVFWKKGYENASADDLLKAMGIGKGSFYLAYKGGKQELFERSAARFFNSYPKGFLEMLKTIENPIDAIKSFFYVLADPKNEVGKQGCYFGNTILQAENKIVKKLAADQLVVITKAFTEALKRAKKSGYLKSEVSIELLGYHLLVLWNGINVTKNIEKDPAKLKSLIDLGLKILE